MIQTKTITIDELNEDLIESMFKLFNKYYDNITYDNFIKDLSNKNYIIKMLSNSKLIGFTTIECKTKLVNKKKAKVLFSGNTVVHEDFWGSRILQKSFTSFLIKTKLRHPNQKIYWMLMSKGYKTYMLMRKNFKHSFPNYNKPIPNYIRNLKDQFYSEKYGQNYSSETHIISSTGKDFVKDGITEPRKIDLTNPDINYFIKTNSLYSKGHELANVAKISNLCLIKIFVKYTALGFIKILPSGKKIQRIFTSAKASKA